MLRLESEALEKEAVEIFSSMEYLSLFNYVDIMKYMGDVKIQINRTPEKILRHIVQRGLRVLQLRDEIYCQLMRQTNKNPKEYVIFAPLLISSEKVPSRVGSC